MAKRIGCVVFLFGLGWILGIAGADAAEGDRTSKPGDKIKVVILVGGHGYDAAGFDRLWSGYDDIAAEVWKGAPYTAFDDIGDFKFDAIVMYNLSSGITDTQKQNLLKLLDKGVGLVVWHHALANCQGWPEFEKIAGGRFWMKPGDRGGVKVGKSGTGGGRVKMHIEDSKHPITSGIADFEIQDETYNRQTFTDDIHVLVSTDHPKSDKQIAWVKTYAKARVFGYQTGHGPKTWANESFQRILGQGIRWVAGRLPAK